MTVIIDGTNGVQSVDGSAGTASLTNDGDTNTGIFFPAADTLAVTTAGTERLRVDSAGNMGLGVTPSAWSGVTAMQIGTQGSIVSTGNLIYVKSNTYYDGTNDRYIASSTASDYYQNAGQHIWRTAASGTAGNTITFTQAMTLDASGRLGVGLTNPSVTFNVDHASHGVGMAYMGASALPTIAGLFTDSSSGQTGYGSLLVKARSDFGGFYSINFYTASSANTPTERARITSGGYFKAQGNSTYIDLAGAYHEFVASSGTSVLIVENKNNVSTAQCLVSKLGSNSNDTSSYHYIAATGGSDKLYIYGNGNVVNVNNSYGTLSDVKLKTDIVDAGSQWDDIKAVRFRKFKMKNDPTGLVQFGLVAQELEQTSPGLVDEHADRDAEGNDLGTTTKSVKTSILLMKAAKALQEAMSRIEQLEAKVAAAGL